MIDARVDDGDGLVRASGMTCFVGLGGFLAWAGLVPLEEGVAAGGKVIVENDRQVVQHFEGGIVEQIYVREGEMVEAGAVVVTLRETASLSNRDQLQTQIAALVAREVRLEAVLSGSEALDFSGLDAFELRDNNRVSLVSEERNLFEADRAALQAQTALLEQRATAAQRTAALRAEQIASTQTALDVAEAELVRFKRLLEMQTVRRDQVTRLEREVAGLRSDIARLTSEQEEASASARDAGRQVAQLRAERRQRASEALRDARAERLAALESLNAAQDVLNRAVIFAPVSGEVLNLRYTTPGAVVPSAETIMEIVPSDQTVVASVRVRPNDRASVFEGQTVRTEISAYRSWQSPRLAGEVVSVSADLKTDQTTGVDYYEARIILDVLGIDNTQSLDITPGMPVNTFIYSGQSRTTLDYLFAPLMDSVFKGLRTG